MKYRITRIDEPEFGCEGKQDGMPAVDQITIEDEKGVDFQLEMDEMLVWERKLDEGVWVTLETDGTLVMAEA